MTSEREHLRRNSITEALGFAITALIEDGFTANAGILCDALVDLTNAWDELDLRRQADLPMPDPDKCYQVIMPPGGNLVIAPGTIPEPGLIVRRNLHE